MLIQTGSLLLLFSLLAQGCATNSPVQMSGTASGETLPAKPASSTVSGAETAPAAGAAMRVYRDPVTGEITSPPSGALPPAVSPSIRDAISTEPAPEMRETALDGGGAKVDLQGRFRSYLSVKKDAEGNVMIQCSDKLHTHTHEHKSVK